MATKVTYPRPAVQRFLFWQIYIIELVTEVDGLEVSSTMYSIHPTAEIAAEAASRIPTLTVED